MEIRNNSTAKTDVRRETTGGVASTARGNQAGEAAGKSEAAPAQGDRVTLTDTAQRLLQEAAADAGAPVDEAKVAAIRQAIADGSYAVDSKQIAAKLVELDNPPRS